MTRRLFDKTVAKTSKAVVTEYAWDAGTCDPCPGPVITAAKIASLGGDVLLSAKPPPDVGNQIARPGVRPRPFRSGMFSGFVLTRLHARYSKESLGEDLVFKAAPPIGGGRVNRSANGELEHGSVASSNNDFQGRYAIRHAWGRANRVHRSRAWSLGRSTRTGLRVSAFEAGIEPCVRRSRRRVAGIRAERDPRARDQGRRPHSVAGDARRRSVRGAGEEKGLPRVRHDGKASAK